MGALGKGLEYDEKRAGIGGIRERRPGKADHVHGASHPRYLARNLRGAAVDLIGARKRGARRELNDGNEIADDRRGNKSQRRQAKFVEPEDDDSTVDNEHEQRRAGPPARPAIHNPAAIMS